MTDQTEIKIEVEHAEYEVKRIWDFIQSIVSSDSIIWKWKIVIEGWFI